MGPRRIVVTTRRLLVTDLDGTLLGDELAVDRFRSWLGPRRDTWGLVFATGRSLRSVVELEAEAGLPSPDAIISGVGTEVHDAAGGAWPGWRERFDGWHAQRVRDVLGAFTWLDPQRDEHQTGLKASYTVRGLTAADAAEIRRALAEADIAARIVYSGSLNLDVISVLAGKGEAAGFLARALGIASDDVLVFGDSGNDTAMMTAGFRGTIVANALPELRAAVGSDVYRSPLRFADGILDGIRHWTSASSAPSTGSPTLARASRDVLP